MTALPSFCYNKNMNTLKKLLSNEIIKYLIAGVLSTLVYISIRLGLFALIPHGTLTATIANLCAITFAFFINDRYVFSQKKLGWQGRFVKFFLARLSTLALDFALTFVLVDAFPQVIGQFVNHNLSTVNAIVTFMGQVLILVGNYLISKFFVFKKK